MKKRFTEEQIIGFLREAESGLPVEELCRRHGFSEASYYLWRNKFGGMSVSDAKRLKELELENARLKRLPSALGLNGPHRPHRHSSHHGPRLAACRVVAHRDEGIAAAAPGTLSRGLFQNPGAAVAAPGSNVQNKIAPSPPSARRGQGGAGFLPRTCFTAVGRYDERTAASS